MADHLLVPISGGTATVQTKDNTTYHTPAHQLVRSDGTNPLKVLVEDAASVSADTGIGAMFVRNDSDGTLTDTDADNGFGAIDSAGRQKVNVIEERVVLDVTPTCDTSGYTGGDVLFDTITCGTVGRINGGTVVLESVTVLDEDDNTAAQLDLFFLDTNTSLGTVNGAPSISDANARKIVGHVKIASTDFFDLGGAKFASIPGNSPGGIGLAMKCASGSQILYVAGVTNGTPTQTASGIKLKLAFRRGV